MPKRPHILITNDDGVHAPGIKKLWESLKDIADLTVIAPTSEQSAKSLSITLRAPLMIEAVHWNENSDVWCVSGTPADCVKLGSHVIFKKKPDLVVSGINRGSNAGRNVLYSGTVAATIEASLQGIPAIAFSSYDYFDTDYTAAAEHAPSIVNYILKNPLPNGTLLNVNFPGKEAGEVKGFKLTPQGKEYWAENPSERSHPAENHTYYWLGARLAQFDEEEDCDISWLKRGYVTGVPIHVNDMTDKAHLALAKDGFEEAFQAQSNIEKNQKISLHI